MKKLVLAEKPSVGKEIARVLGCGSRGKSYCEGKSHIVTWAMGHLVELAEPTAYDERFQKWDLNLLPMLPERMKHQVIRKSSHQFRQIQSLLKRKELGEVIIATDAGREGELVARWILRLGGWKGKVSRLWISSQTDKAIREGFKNLKPGADYENLSRAAECRAEADWLIGLNVSRAMSCRYDTKLTAGRVQTPTLALLIEREKKIRRHVPEAYWTVEADYGPFQARWQGKHGPRISDQARVEALLEELQGQTHCVRSVTVKESRQAPPQAYDLTELQREANKQMGFSAKKTLQVLQGLYERHKIVTYPRTDSRFITSDMKETLPDRLKALGRTPWAEHAARLASSPLNPGKRLINDAGVTDHHAIIPTEETVDLAKLDSDEKMLWDLIARRFLAVLSPPAVSESITVAIEAGKQRFSAKGKRLLSRGWRELEHSRGEEKAPDERETHFSGILPREGEALSPKSLRQKKGMTAPPARYTEGTLLSAMENPGPFLKDASLAKTLKQGGLGTPATRADIIEKLLKHYYMERQGKELRPTLRGEELMALVPEVLRFPDLTAQWENAFTAIAEGKKRSADFRNEIRKHAKELTEAIKHGEGSYRPKETGGPPCPFCGRAMITTKGKRGRTVRACLALSCGYEEEQGGRDRASGSGGPSRKERALNQKLIRQYGNGSEETVTLGDMIRISEDKRKKKAR